MKERASQSQAIPLCLKTPPQDLQMLSFCSPQPKHLQGWADALPRMNVGETAKHLYSAIQEINRFNTDVKTQYQMLEALREPIQFICESLSKHFLNKPVILPPKESKIANLSQALQTHLATGYKSVVAKNLPQLTSKNKDARLFSATTIHRTLVEKSCILLRSFLLYYPAPTNFWGEVSFLYLLAEDHDLLEISVTDPAFNNSHSTICDVYRQILLLATAKPNQLRQQQILQIYNASAVWAKFTSLHSEKNQEELHTIDLLNDAPPAYSALLKSQANSEKRRFFCTSALSNALKFQLQLPSDQVHPTKGFSVPNQITSDLVRLLVQAWGTLAERSFSRIKEKGQLTLCLGLSATHYYVSDKGDFQQQIKEDTSNILNTPAENPFINKNNTPHKDTIDNSDVWGLNVDTHKNRLNSKQNTIDNATIDYQVDKNQCQPASDKYPSYQCTIINSSPAGFCLSWAQDVPPQVKTGEIIGVQEPAQQHWSIGVVRWVKQFKGEGARMGVELLAPSSLPCGAQVIHKKGQNTEFMRTLELPELKAIDQPATLITPNIVFRIGYKVYINRDGLVGKAQLVKQILSTASFSQFQYKWITPPPQQATQTDSSDKINANDDSFDSIWSSL